MRALAKDGAEVRAGGRRCLAAPTAVGGAEPRAGCALAGGLNPQGRPQTAAP